MTDLKRCFQRFTIGFGSYFFLTVAFFPSPTIAQSEADDLAQDINPVADALLRDLGDYIDTAEQFTVGVEVEVDELSPRGQKIQYTSTLDIALQGDNRLYSYEVGDLRNRTLWFDGDQFTVLDRDLSHYVSVDTPNNVQDAILFLEDQGIVFALSDFVTGNFYQGVSTNIETGDYLGLHQVGDQLCHHLAFTQTNIDWQIWIADGFEVVPCKLLITYKNLPESPQYTAYFEEWNFAPRLPDRLFNFVPPEGTSEIDFLPPQ